MKILNSVPMEPIPDAKDDGTGMPYATHMGFLSIGEHKIKCWQLDGGYRVLDADHPFLKELVEGLKDIPTPEAQVLYKKLTQNPMPVKIPL